MGNTQGNEVKTKIGKPSGKVKALIKVRGKRVGKTADVQFLEIVSVDKNEKQKNILDISEEHKEEIQIPPANEESSSDSIFTDPLTPLGISTEINTCYYSEENIDTNVVVANTFLELPLNRFKLNEEEKLRKLSKLGFSEMSQISLECNPRYCFTSENVECVQGDDTFLFDSVESSGPEYKRQSSEPATSLEDKEHSLVLKRVVSLTLDKEMLECKVSKPKFVPEKLDFKLYEKFEGHMLINWYLSEFYDNDHLKKIVQNKDLKLLATQFCTHLLAAGVLHQIPDKDVPMYNTFKPDLMYYWAHSETPASVPQTPGRLNSLYWPPTSPSMSDAFAPVSTTNSETTTVLKKSLTELEPEQSELEEEKNRLKREIERYQTLIEIQTLTTNVVEDFDPSNITKHFICDQCGFSSNYSKKSAQLLNDQEHNLKMSTTDNSVNEKSKEETELLTNTLTNYKTSPSTDSHSDTKPLPKLDNTTQSQSLEFKSRISPSSSSIIPVPPPLPPDTSTVSSTNQILPTLSQPDEITTPSPSSFACEPPLSTPLPPPPPPPPPLPPPPPPPPPSSSPFITPQSNNGVTLHSPSLGEIPASVQSEIPPPPPLLPPPLPTPPIGGWVSTKSMLNKEAVTPKVPMKPLYWTRIIMPNTSNVESFEPIWSQVEELELENLSEFSNLFSRQVIQRTATKKKVETATKIKPVKMLDSKRSQNVGILAQSLHVDFSEIENAIYTFDTSVVSLEALQQIYEIRATPEELKQIQQHLEQNPDIPLDKPEQFLYDLSEISNFPERISCFMFQIEFGDLITNIENTLTNMKSTCDFLTDNHSLIKILSIILTLGNYMNGGNITRGQADGYNLEILSKLKDVKSNDAQVTLLHFIVRTYMDQFDYIVLMEMSLPVPDSEDIRKAASVNFDEVGANLHVLEKKLKACEHKIKTVLEAATIDNIEPFQEKMKTFIQNVKEQLNTEFENLENCKTKFVSTMKMYQFKSKAQTVETTLPSDFFELWYLFCKDFKDIWKKELIRREKEKKYELKLKEALRKSEIVRVDLKPNSIKEKVKKLVQEEIN